MTEGKDCVIFRHIIDLFCCLLQVLDSALRDLYKMLKHVYTVEKDDTVKLHITMALKQLHQIMTDFLFPKQTLTKRISITQSPNVDLGFR